MYTAGDLMTIPHHLLIADGKSPCMKICDLLWEKVI